MKPFLFAVSLSAIWAIPAWADDAVKGGDTYETLAKESIETIDRFTAILAKIKDKKSAEEVKQEFDDNAKKMTDLKNRSEKLGEPPPERQAELKKMFQSKFQGSIKKLQQELDRIAKDVEGGKEIFQEFSKSLAPLTKKDKK
jgi:hypothetical protein